MTYEKQTHPLLLTDFYKTVHSEQYPAGTEYLTAYFTPRMTRIASEPKLIAFGFQYFIKKYLIDTFNDYFFNVDIEETIAEYERTLHYTLGAHSYNSDKVRELHELGYLPLKISAVEEGIRMPIQVPMIEITNTDPKFAWVVNAIESLWSANSWSIMIAANVGYRTRKIVNEAYRLTAEDNVSRSRAISEFSLRGQEGTESAIAMSAAFLLSHENTATIPAMKFHEYYYGANIETETVGLGLPSTEHSVMCSNFEVDGDEATMYRRLLTEIYPESSFSVVADSYDYWNIIENVLPTMKSEVEAHKGTMFVRGDSGDPIEIVAGKKVYEAKENETKLKDIMITELDSGRELDTFEYNNETVALGTVNDKFYVFNLENEMLTEVDLYELPVEAIGTVAALYKSFPGYVNSKGYKVLHDNIRVMYGDSITTNRMTEIFDRLRVKGFAANNTSLGVGSFSFQAHENENYELSPYTRDTYGIAVKTTHGVVNGKEIFIEKNPKTDKGDFKKSQKGLVAVTQENGNIVATDQLTIENKKQMANDLLKPLFVNGKLAREDTLNDVRQRLHKGEF